MASMSESLERSLENCSLNQSSNMSRRGEGERWSGSSVETIHDFNEYDNPKKHEGATSDENSTFVDLKSSGNLPYHWEQCLDLKSGELYYRDWRKGAKAKEAPTYNGGYYRENGQDEEEDDDDESRLYDREGWWTESSCCSSNEVGTEEEEEEEVSEEIVLVVGGCKRCLMYYMVGKHVEQCPKCSADLVRFPADANHNSFP